jgi:hypothetical protein
MLSGKTLASFGLLGRGIEGEETKDRSKLMNSEDYWRVFGEAFSREQESHCMGFIEWRAEQLR